MWFDLSRIKTYHVVCGYTDLRLGIDGLIAKVMLDHKMVLDDECLFLFCGRRADRIKALYWSGYDFYLLYTRHSDGHFKWPRSPAGSIKTIDANTFHITIGLRDPGDLSSYSKTPNVDLF